MTRVPKSVVWGTSAVGGVALAAGLAVIPVVAGASPSLPARTPAQLLAGLAQADKTPFSGQLVQTSRLGLPDIPGLSGLTSRSGQEGQSLGSLISLLSGSHYAKVWYAGHTQARVAVTVGSVESDVVRNGRDVWLWDGNAKRATHGVLPADTDSAVGAATTVETPQQLANQALAAVSPTTAVSVEGTARVAHRKAYELVLRPKQSGTTIREVRLAIDSKTSVPLRVQVWATSSSSPAFETSFQSITFAKPDASAFRFRVPAGGTVKELPKPTEKAASALPKGTAKAREQAQQGLSRLHGDTGGLRVIGDGWTSVLALPKGSLGGLGASGSTSSGAASGKASQGSSQSGSSLSGALSGISLGTKVSGAYGSGRVISTTLVSVLVLDDGRAYAGAVTPTVLEHAAATR